MKNKLFFLIAIILIAGSAGFCADIGWVKLTDTEVTDSSNTAIIPGGIVGGKIIMGVTRTAANGGCRIISSTDCANFIVEKSSFGGTDNVAIRPAHNTFSTASPGVRATEMYAFTNNSTAGAEVWKTSDGTTWSLVTINSSFGNYVNGLRNTNLNYNILGEVFAGSLAAERGLSAIVPFFIGVSNGSGGCEIWKFDGTEWTQDATAVANLSGHSCENPAEPGCFFNSLTFFGTWHFGCAGFAGGLYSSASPWTTITMKGFDTFDNYGLIPAHKGFSVGGTEYLYVGTYNAEGAQVWRSPTGGAYDSAPPGDWEKVVDFSSAAAVAMSASAAGTQANPNDNNCTWANTFSIPGDGYLYVGLNNTTTGAEIWRTDGTTWEQINADDMDGDSGTLDNDLVYLSRTLFSVTTTSSFGATTTTNQYLFAGTEPEGQLWRVPLITETTTEPEPESEVIPDVVEKKGDIAVVASNPERKGVINPDKGDKVEIQFEGSKPGKYTLRIFTLLGELVYDETKDTLASGKFSWIPEDIASGIYIIHVEGPGVDIHKKVAILR